MALLHSILFYILGSCIAACTTTDVLEATDNARSGIVVVVVTFVSFDGEAVRTAISRKIGKAAQ